MLIRILNGDYNLCYWAAFSVFTMNNNKVDKLDGTINLPLFDPPDILSSNKKEISKDNAIIEFTISNNQLMVYLYIYYYFLLLFFRFNNN